MKKINLRKVKRTQIGQQVELFRQDAIDAIHTNYAAAQLAAQAGESMALLRSRIRDVANKERVRAAEAESNATSLEEVALGIGLNVASVDDHFDKLAHL